MIYRLKILKLTGSDQRGAGNFLTMERWVWFPLRCLQILEEKCVRGCVFAPYFCHEQGATHFAAIHKVFGASNVSKLLAHLPVSDRCEAAVTISYEAQARLQDPIYGCVNLQAQLASLKEQAAQCLINNSNITANPNDQKFYGGSHSNFSQDVQSWWNSFQNQGTMPQFDANFNNNNINIENMTYYASGTMNPNDPSMKYENSGFPEENTSFGSMDSLEMQSNERQWPFQDDADDLQSVPFRYINNQH
ncbi:LOB domain-containing protein 29 [Sesamum angolense]|uniref:LOB domain-containing protein 29 n=1 Tax=Sesamum angolense TaxID=2727404 RepID=A0AAE1X8K0_9LAMI|nr:LOB domain-containing protein 29 [Sesamum angolense]